MGVQSRFRAATLVLGILLLAALLGMPSGGQAAHDLNRDCYVCHNIKGGAIWKDSYSIWSGMNIGMNPYSRPITCDICHTDYRLKFSSTSVSKHPVRIIVAGDNTRADNNVYGSSPAFVDCRDCHSGNQTTPPSGAPLNPDVSPLNYSGLSGNGVSDGYPNHDNTIAGYTITAAAWGAGNVVTPGTQPHLGSSYDPAAVYNKVPSNAPLTDYALCFSCHDGTAGRTNRRVDVKTRYSTGKGHYYKYGTPTGGANGMKMPCSDCHASHNAANNSRLYVSPKGTTGGLLNFANAASPTAAEIRFLCMDCHDDYNSTNTGNGQPLVRGVEPPVRKYGIPGHAGTDTQSCSQCHDPHDTPGGGPDCLTCHTTGGAAGATSDYIDAMFKGVGSDNTATQPASVGSLTWSQHGGFVSVGGAARFLYTSPYNTKASNDCFKCHGDRHNNTYSLIDADNTDSFVYSPSLGMNDNTAAGITNANAFCLTCHDGNGAAADVQIGNVAPPNVAANYVTGGHGRPQASGAYTVSLNNPAYLKCTDCHEAHGSNHAKLLPAKKSEVTANFTIPSNFPEKTFRSGGSTLLARDIDFTDYSSPASGKGFGTTGDPGDQHAPAGATTGFCDACHRFAGRANRGTDNVTNVTHTHEGIVGDLNQSSPSQMTFTKDCLECHDTHGTTNLEMVETTINGVTPVTFTARTGANSFDPLETGVNPNVNSVCVACHQNSTENPALNVAHNFRTSTVNPDHNEDTNCATCHPHGNPAEAKKFGFPQAACNSCHGAASDSTGMPGVSPADPGVYHTDANNPIATRGGAGNDNTAHKIHVNYLVNRRGVAAASACYVCHKGGGAQESHPGNPTNQSFKTGGQPSGDNVQVAMDNGGTGSILNVWNNAGAGPTYSGTPGQAADATNGWKTCSNTKCHFALSPSWSGKQQIANYLAVTNGANRTLPPLTAYGKGADNVVVNQFRMATTAGTGATTATSIVITGVNVSGNVAASGVRVYRDSTADNVWSSSNDTPVGAAVSFAADNTATVSGITEPVNETGANYWIVLTFSGAPTNGAVVNARVTSLTTPLPGGSQVSTTNAPLGTTVDTQLPTSAVTTTGYFTAAPVNVAGTASDGNSGVNHVDITIRNGATGNYWNGSAFGSATPVWLAAAGSTSWSYSFNPSVAVDNTFYVQSRATDNVVNVQTALGTGSFVLDRVRPTVTSAVAQDNTHVLVTFSEAVDNTAAGTVGYYTIAGLTVSAAARREAIDNATVLLTTSLQTALQAYTVVVDNVAPGVADIAGNVVGNPGSANFTGYSPNSVTVTDGPNDPSAILYLRGGGSGTGRLVSQQFRMATASGTASVTQIVVTKAGLATVSTNGAHLYRDAGSVPGSLDGTDVQIGGTGIPFSGATATFTVSETANTTGTNYLVVIDIDNSATTDGQQLTTQITGVTASIGVSNTSTVSRTLSMDKTLPTSTITTTSPYTTGNPTDNVTIAGTAADAAGTNPSGVNHVDVSIQRVSGGQWWNGSTWGASQTWLATNGGTPEAWSYTAAIGDNTFNVQARSTDNSNDNTFTAGNGNVQSPVTTLSGLVVDRVHPTVVSATAATDATHVTVVFSEQLETTSAQTATYYTIAGLTVSAAVLSADNVTVTLTTSQQTASANYTVVVDNTAPGVTGRNGNVVGNPGSASFTGFGLTFNSHTYWMFRPTTTQTVYADGNSPSAWTSGTVNNTAPHNASMATTTATPAPGGLGTAVNYRNYNNGTGFVFMRFYIWDNLAVANTIQAGTVSGQAALRANATATQFWFSLWEYDPAGAAGNGIQIGADSNVLTNVNTATTTNYAWTINIASNYTIPAGHRLELRCYVTCTGATTTVYNRIYFGPTTAGATSTSFTISETTTQANLAPPRTTGATTAIACNSCHQFAPDDTTAGYKDGNQYYYALPGSHVKHGVALTAGNDPVADNALNTCTICHAATTNTFGSDHMDGIMDLRSGTIGTRTAGPAYADDGTYDNATRTCSNVYCHAGRPTPQATGKSWGYGSTAVCGACHAVTPPYGKHAVHNNGNVATTPTETSTATNYDYSCYYCHPSGTAHVNYPVSAVQAAQVSFSGTLGDNTLSGTYTAGASTAGWDNVTNQGLSWTNGSCATYCHTNGQGQAALVTPTWNHAGFPTATCVGCHDTRGATTTLSTRHRKHTDNTAVTGYNFSCDECHTLTVANGSWTTLNATTGRPNHVDGIKTVSFSSTLRATAVAISGSYTQGVDNCASTYCHSDGSSIKNGGTIQANSIRWDNTTTPLPCNSCHGVGGANGAPNYVTSGSRRNSHAAHASITCQTCHSLTTTTGNSITTASNHVNGTYEVSGAGFTYAFNASTGSTCAFTSGCHSGTPTWGTPLTGGCFSCHAGTEVANKPLEAVDGIANPVDNTQYNSYGHGNSTTFSWDAIAGPAFLYSNTGSPNSGCHECHSSGANHVPKSATDPYRLGAWTDNVDGLCNDCHGPSSGNPRKAQNPLNDNILGHNKTNTGSGKTWPGNYDYKCVDCHDPHGDANYYLIRSAINNPTSSADTGAGSNVYGTPKDNTLTVVTFTSTAGYTANSYAISGTGDGICEVCHTQTIYYKRNDATVQTHNTTARCTTCHKHDGGFKASCTDCHGNSATGEAWPDGIANNPTRSSYADDAGAHLKHVNAIAAAKGWTTTTQKNGSCNICHPGNPPPGHSTDTATGANQAEVIRMAINPDNTANYWRTGVSATDTGGTPVYFQNMAGASDPLGVYRMSNETCANLSCHGGSTTFNWYYGPDNAAPVWASGMNITATDCAVGGTLRVQWARAADAYPSNPVRYDLYSSTTPTAAAVYTSVPLYTDLLDNVAVVYGLTNATNYYFGVRAKDSWAPPNVTTDNTISAARAPSGSSGSTCGTGTATTYNGYLGTTQTFGIDGGVNPTTSGSTIPATDFGRQPLRTTTGTTASNYRRTVSTTATPTTIGRFYVNMFTQDTCVGPNLTTGRVGWRCMNTGDRMTVNLESYDPNGLLLNGTLLGSSAAIACTNTGAFVEYPFTITYTQYKVPANDYLVLEFSVTAAATGDQRVQFGADATSASRVNFTTPVYTIPNDIAAPVWAGSVSGITAVDNQIGGAIKVSWNTATDAYPSNPVKYDLFRSTDNTILWSSPYRTNLGVTTILDTGLTNGTRYYYGVRAEDSWPTPNVTTNVDNASAIPTGGAPIQSCTACHGMPPDSDSRNRGSHVKHVPADSPATECTKCHPGASSYGYGHQDGKGQLGFSGTAYNAIYGNPTATTLRYNNGTQDFYVDSDGYGFLTGVAGDNTDNGTCSATVCHESGTPQWGGTLTGGCGACHVGTGDIADYGTGTAASMINNGRKARIDNAQWLFSGHGKASGTYDKTLHPAAAFAGTNPCLYCHDSTVLHGVTSNIFRLANYNYYGNGWNDTCLICHRNTGGSAGYNYPGGPGSKNAASARVDEAHYGYIHGATVDNTGGKFCFDCHEPHGDSAAAGQNIFMIGDRVSRATDTVLGIPKNGNDNSYRPQVVFTDNTSGTFYADNAAPYNKICNVCHYGAVKHFRYNYGDAHNRTTKCTTCHKHDAGFQAACGDCHDAGGGVGAPIVTSASTHVKVTAAGAFKSCTACHGGHYGSFGGANIPNPPTAWNNNNTGTVNLQTNLGIHYTTNGGIHLGGEDTVGATEAQICWNCHTTTNAAAVISEWGTNTNTATGSMVYDYGKVCADNTSPCDTATNWEPDWTKAWWRSAYEPAFAYKRGRIQSTHAANAGGTYTAAVTGANYAKSETVDNVANIRCSYCHDVHELAQATGDTKAGPPYLRGTWRGNPFKEDGAPHSTSTYATFTGNLYGAVPRGGTAYQNMGGYFIGQNTAANDNTQTQASFAGLCNLCHNPGGTAAGTDNMDITTGEALWIGNNGHSATVIGGTGAHATNIFDYTHGRPVPVFTNSTRNYSNHVPSMGMTGATAGYSYRGSQGGNYAPVINGSPYAFRSYNWGATVGTSQAANPINANYHDFTCAKCHNPHASRLPKLLLTNCLDVQHNTWDDGKSTQSLYTAAALTDKGRKTAYYNSAQNCHRYYNDGTNTLNQGWNKVSPWQ